MHAYHVAFTDYIWAQFKPEHSSLKMRKFSKDRESTQKIRQLYPGYVEYVVELGHNPGILYLDFHIFCCS